MTGAQACYFKEPKDRTLYLIRRRVFLYNKVVRRAQIFRVEETLQIDLAFTNIKRVIAKLDWAMEQIVPREEESIPTRNFV